MYCSRRSPRNGTPRPFFFQAQKRFHLCTRQRPPRKRLRANGQSGSSIGWSEGSNCWYLSFLQSPAASSVASAPPALTLLLCRCTTFFVVSVAAEKRYRVVRPTRARRRALIHVGVNACTNCSACSASLLLCRETMDSPVAVLSHLQLFVQLLQAQRHPEPAADEVQVPDGLRHMVSLFGGIGAPRVAKDGELLEPVCKSQQFVTSRTDHNGESGIKLCRTATCPPRPNLAILITPNDPDLSALFAADVLKSRFLNQTIKRTGLFEAAPRPPYGNRRRRHGDRGTAAQVACSAQAPTRCTCIQLAAFAFFD